MRFSLIETGDSFYVQTSDWVYTGRVRDVAIADIELEKECCRWGEIGPTVHGFREAPDNNSLNNVSMLPGRVVIPRSSIVDAQRLTDAELKTIHDSVKKHQKIK